MMNILHCDNNDDHCTINWELNIWRHTYIKKNNLNLPTTCLTYTFMEPTHTHTKFTFNGICDVCCLHQNTLVNSGTGF